MPEIAEVTRVVHYLRQNLSGRRISGLLTQNDDIIYGKVGTSASEFQEALTGRTVLNARQQGKYFWLVMDKPPHPLMHLGMTGWVKLSNIETGYYKPKKDSKDGEKQAKLTDGIGESSGKVKTKEDGPEAVYNNAGSTREGEQEWPPKYYKFVMQMEGEPKVEAAFVDARRLGRIRLIDVPAEEMRDTTPLKENGPDPVLDPDILTPEWLTEKLHSKKNPIKAALIDQAVISGVGNWVADEILHHACVHPEQYCNTLTDAQCKELHTSLTFVCKTACDLLGDSDQYPEDWIFKYRWSKGKKDAPVLPNGEEIQFVTAGGRTSAFVASRQKKTGAVAADVEDGSDEDVEEPKPKAKAKPKTKAPGKAKVESDVDEDSDEDAEEDAKETKHKNNAKPKTRAPREAKVESDVDDEDADPDGQVKPAQKSGRKRKAAGKDAAKPKSEKKTKVNGASETPGSRRSSRRK